MQIKTTVRFHVTPVRISLTKKSTNNKCWRECQKQWNTFWPLVGLLIGTNTMENRWKCLKKLKKKCHMIQQSHSWASVQFSSVQSLSHVWLFPVHHQFPEFTRTHVHRVSDAIQPSDPLSSPSPPVPNPSQHQSLFQRVNSLHEVAKVLEFQL